MERLEAAQQSLFFSSCGTQHEALKETKPQWSLGKASRDDEKKVYISSKHPQDLLGKDSPGFAYSPKRQKQQPSFGFGTSAARPPLSKAKYPESSNDLLSRSVDYTQFKYRSKSAVVLQSSRDSAYYQPGFDGFPAGAISPGPQRYSPSPSVPGHRFAHAPGVDKISPKYTMRPLTKDKLAESQTPARVGPGTYPVPEACASQVRSEKPTLPQWSVNKTERFKNNHQQESGRLWDGNGDKARQFNRAYSSAPSFSFGTSTRGHQRKVVPAVTALDKGPVGDLGKGRLPIPELPRRKDVMKWSDVPTGA